MAEPGGCLEAASSRLLAHLLPGQHAHTGLWVRVVCGVCGPCVVCEQKARVLPVAPGSPQAGPLSVECSLGHLLGAPVFWPIDQFQAKWTQAWSP